MFNFVAFIPSAVKQSIPLLLGSTGETLTEKSGNLNLGIPGIMYVGAISGVIGSFFYENHLTAVNASINPFLGIAIPILCSLLGSLLMGLLYCFLTVNLRANQNVTGLAMTTFGVGFGNFFGGSLIKLTGSDVPSISLRATSGCFQKTLPFADKTGVIGKLLFSYGFLAYTAIIIAILAALFLRKTRLGLQLRAVGENPGTADAAGINVSRIHDCRTWRSVLRHGLCVRCLVEQRLRRQGLARHRTCHLHGLETGPEHLCIHPVRRSVHSVSLHPDRNKHGHQGNL